jgi:enoyl-CoA hydratase
MGPRRAKEFILTGDFFTSRDLLASGFINRVVPDKDLAEATLRLARRIAAKPSLGLKLAKQSVNQMQEAQGIHAHLSAAFALTTIGQYDLVQQGGLERKQATEKGLFTSAMQDPDEDAR